MGNSAKLRIATLLLAASMAAALYGFWRLQSEVVGGQASPVSFVLVFAGSTMGLAACVYRIYLKSRHEHDKSAGQVRVETLAAAGRQQRDKTVR